jgi:hypothetical protein
LAAFIRAVKVSRRSLALGLLLALGSGAGHADPWLAPGDEGIRDDLMRLADAGILRGPMTTWPLSWPDIARDALTAESGWLDDATASALVRVQRRARAAMVHGSSGLEYRVSGATDAAGLRSFEDTPREQGEISANISLLGNQSAIRLQANVVTDPADGKHVRPDGSYIGVNVANYMVSVGWMERWWGPGWDGSLILSTNARPIPTFTIERNYTDPFETRWLSWIGPWRASIAVGQMEGHDVELPEVRFLAARVNFKPASWLEFGVSRTAQWCGEGRPCGWSTFGNLLVGRDNQVDNGSKTDQPGNQLAGYDVRVRSPWKRLPLAFYSQWIGEDEAGGLPAKFLGQFGLESWISTPLGGVRAQVEYSNTACNFSRSLPLYDCAYRNDLYPQGYKYRGRAIGHSIDSDGRLYSANLLLTRSNGDVAGIHLRKAGLNRDGSAVNAITREPENVRNVELRYSRALSAGKLTVSVAYDQSESDSYASSDFHGFVSWQQGL